jgi:AcrR family transcriptional regulator
MVLVVVVMAASLVSAAQPGNSSESHWNESALVTILVVADPVNTRREYRSPLRAEQAAQTRRRILTAARELFLDRGYGGTTVAAVAEAAGVSPDTVYASVGGKPGLLEGVWAQALADTEEPRRRADDELATLSDPRARLTRLVELSCHVLAATSPVHAVIRGAADGHPHAAELRARMLAVRLEVQAGNVKAHLAGALRKGLSADEAAQRYSALLSPELYHLLTVEQRWPAHSYQTWVDDLLHADLLSHSPPTER